VIARLPRELTSFVGRAHEIEQVAGLLSRAPLVTLAGPGGAGKTRLALQLGHRQTAASTYADGILLVELAALSEPRAVARAVAESLGVAEHSGGSIVDHLVHVLRPKHALLVLDNCEHLLGACAELVEHLLRGCHDLRVLATSRVPLNVAGEVVYRVPPLQLPADDHLETLATSEAGRLFAERAKAANAAFALNSANAAHVAEICRRLDGLPLAIELAAARVAAFAPADIASRLHDAFNILTGGTRTSMPRQQTLEATMRWSYDLLDDDGERLLLDRLSVFVGGFSLAGAQALTATDLDAIDVLPRLVAKSMVQADPRPDGSVRYRLLEPVRQFARQRLVEARQLDRARRQHAEHILAVAEDANRDPNLVGARLREVTLEIDNIRAVLDWAEQVGDAEIALRLGAALWFFWSRPDRQAEGLIWLERARSIPGADQHPVALGRVLAGLAYSAVTQGDPRSGERLTSEALRAGRANGDEWLIAMALMLQGMSDAFSADRHQAEATLRAAIGCAQTSRLPFIEVYALQKIGLLKLAAGDNAAAEAHLREALRIARDQLDAWSVAMALNTLADCCRAQGKFEDANRAYTEALERWMTFDALPYMPPGMQHNFGYGALARGDLQQAASLFLESADTYRAIGNDRRGVADSVTGLACTASAGGHLDLAARLFGSVEAALEQLGTRLMPTNQIEFERGLDMLRASMDADRLAQQSAIGRDLTLDDAVESARVLAASSQAPLGLGLRPDGLTPRELEVAVLLARGLSNRELAEELVITEKTAKNHVQRVLDKLGVRSRAQVASRAEQLGLRR